MLITQCFGITYGKGNNVPGINDLHKNLYDIIFTFSEVLLVKTTLLETGYFYQYNLNKKLWILAVYRKMN